MKLKKMTGVGQSGLIDCSNITSVISTLVSRKYATLHELDTEYSVQDAYDILEIITVDAYNKKNFNSE